VNYITILVTLLLFSCSQHKKEVIVDDYSSFKRFDNGVDSTKNWNRFNKYITEAKLVDKHYTKITKEIQRGRSGELLYYGGKKIKELRYININDTLRPIAFRNLFLLKDNIMVETLTNFDNPLDTLNKWDRKITVYYKDSILAQIPRNSQYSLRNKFINYNTKYFKRMEKKSVRYILNLKDLKDINFDSTN
jgi:hypothetical protein